MGMKIKALFLAITFMAAWGILHFGVSQAGAAGPKSVMKIGIHWGISADWLDPSSCDSGISAHLPLYLFHDALLKPMPEGVSPCLAESWTNSADYKAFEFKLRRGVKFHNGDPLTADDVVFTFKRYKGTAFPLFQRKIEKLEAVDPYLFRVTFKAPFPDFLDYFLPGMSTIGWVVPKNYIEKVGDAGFKKHPVGAGPYKFVEFTAGVRIVGEAFEDFWRKVPHVKRLEFYPVTDSSTRYAMIKRGEIDIATTLTGVFAEKVMKDQDLRVAIPQTAIAWIVYIASQWDPKSPWSDPRVRKAASLALDRKAIVDIHFPGATRLGSLGLPGEGPELLERSADPYDPEGAKKLLAEAGYPKGFHGGKFYPYNSLYWEMGEQVANYWKAVGIDVDTVRLDRAAWVANRRGGKMKGGLFIDPVSAPIVSARLTYLFSPQGSYGYYPEIEALWEQYNKAIDQKVRRDLILRIQKIINDKTMFIYISNSAGPQTLGPRVKGNPIKINKPIPMWIVSPMEDLELNE